jgi:hypothetical protein
MSGINTLNVYISTLYNIYTQNSSTSVNKRSNSYRCDYHNPTVTAAAMVITILDDQLFLNCSPPLIAEEVSRRLLLTILALLALFFALLAPIVPPPAVGLFELFAAIMFSNSGKERDRDIPTSAAVVGIDNERGLRGIDMASTAVTGIDKEKDSVVPTSAAMLGIDKKRDMEVPTSTAVVGIDKESELVTSINSLLSDRIRSV